MDYTQEFFYTAKPIYKKVNKEEFKSFLKNYPRKLEPDAYAVWEPPLISYNDFSLANRWPYSIVAQTYAYDEKPGQYFYCPEEKREYCIVENYEELYNSKTGNKA